MACLNPMCTLLDSIILRCLDKYQDNVESLEAEEMMDLHIFTRCLFTCAFAQCIRHHLEDSEQEEESDAEFVNFQTHRFERHTGGTEVTRRFMRLSGSSGVSVKNFYAKYRAVLKKLTAAIEKHVRRKIDNRDRGVLDDLPVCFPDFVLFKFATKMPKMWNPILSGLRGNGRIECGV